MRRYRILLSVVLALPVLVSSCSKIGKDEAVESKERQDIQLTTKQGEIVEYGNVFALDFIKKTASLTEKDFFVSPFSLEIALGLVNAGATGNTLQEICSKMGVESSDRANLNAYFQSLLKQLPELDPMVKFLSANIGIFNESIKPKSSYVDDVKTFYSAPVERMDFSKGDAVVSKVNIWCSDNTKGMIDKIIDGVSSNDRFLLVNATYFDGKWRNKFDKKKSESEPFHLSSGTTKKIKMMKREGDYSLFGTDKYTSVRIPYGNDAYRLLVILPDEGVELKDVVSSLNVDDIRKMNSRQGSFTVDLWLPSFETSFSLGFGEMNSILNSLGIKAMYYGGLDDIAEDLFVSGVIHKGKIKVSEDGTEAAAATLIMGSGAYLGDRPPVTPFEFHADRPFLYLITEYSTGAILFAGRYGAVTD